MSVIRSLVVLLVLVILIPIAASFLAASQEARAQMNEQIRLNSLERYTIGRGDVQRTASALGSIQTDETVNLSFETSGQIADVVVETGDYVVAGDVLARLVDETQRIDYEQAQLALERANNALTDLLGPMDENDIQVAQANLTSAQGTYTSIANGVTPADIEAAQLRYDQALHVWEELQHQRQVSGGLDQPEEYTLIEAQIGEASFNAEIARLNLEALQTSNRGSLAEAGARIALRQRELDQLLAGPTQAEITSAQITLQQAEARLRDAEAALNRTVLVAPMDGIVTAADIEIGQPVVPGTAVIEVSDVTPLGLTAQVDEVDIGQISVGMPAYVELDALPDVELPAAVRQIEIMGVEVESVVSYYTRFALDEIDPRVRIGMTGEAFVILETREDVLVVPNNFLNIAADGSAFVEMLDANNQEIQIEVQLGLQGDEFSEVVSGLREGDVIVVEQQSINTGFPGGQ
jgi:HlyD family secretion protein